MLTPTWILIVLWSCSAMMHLKRTILHLLIVCTVHVMVTWRRTFTEVIAQLNQRYRFLHSVYILSILCQVSEQIASKNDENYCLRQSQCRLTPHRRETPRISSYRPTEGFMSTTTPLFHPIFWCVPVGKDRPFSSEPEQKP